MWHREILFGKSEFHSFIYCILCLYSVVDKWTSYNCEVEDSVMACKYPQNSANFDCKENLRTTYIAFYKQVNDVYK